MYHIVGVPQECGQLWRDKQSGSSAAWRADCLPDTVLANDTGLAFLWFLQPHVCSLSSLLNQPQCIMAAHTICISCIL